MKAIILTYIFTLFSVCALAQKDVRQVPYFLPHKDYTATIVYTITDVKVFKKEGKTIQSKNLLRHYTRVSIEDPIKIEGKMRWSSDTIFYFDFSSLGSGGKSFEMAFGFDTEGNGTISSFNGSQEPVTADIIQGTASIVGGVIGIVAKNIIPTLGFNSSDSDGEIVVTDNQKIEVQRLLTLDSPTTIDFTPFEPKAGIYKYPFSGAASIDFYNLVTPIPSVTIEFKDLGIQAQQKTKDTDKSKESPAGAYKTLSSSNKLHYRIPRQYKITATIKNNLFAKEYIAIEQVVFIPQKGITRTVPIELVKGKRNLEITFNSITGNLAKYSLKKESSLKASLSQIKASTDELSTSIKDLQDAQSKLKEDKSVQDEIDKLKLEIEKLKLLKEKKQLLEPDPETEN